MEKHGKARHRWTPAELELLKKRADSKTTEIEKEFLLLSRFKKDIHPRSQQAIAHKRIVLNDKKYDKRNWEKKDDLDLYNMWINTPMNYEEMGLLLHRSPSAVTCRITHLGIREERKRNDPTLQTEEPVSILETANQAGIAITKAFGVFSNSQSNPPKPEPGRVKQFFRRIRPW